MKRLALGVMLAVLGGCAKEVHEARATPSRGAVTPVTFASSVALESPQAGHERCGHVAFSTEP